MSVSNIYSRYPTLCSIARYPQLEDDLKLAATTIGTNPRAIVDLHNSRAFKANELIFCLCVDELAGFKDSIADEIENNLKRIVAAVGLDVVTSAYRDKLLINDPNAFTDVRYEIAIAAAASSYLEDKSLTLESPIENTAVNSDLQGLRKGWVCRMEVRVVHDDWPPSISPELLGDMENASIPTGYCVSLRYHVNESTARRVREYVEEFYEAWDKQDLTEGQTLILNTTVFSYDVDNCEIMTNDTDCPVNSIKLSIDDDIRIVTPPVYTRSMVDPQERDYFENEKTDTIHVFNGHDVDQRTYKDLPLSTRIAQAVQSKTRQCESGVCNIVVLGTPAVYADNDVRVALLGPIAATYTKGSDGALEDAEIELKPSGMFVPEGYSESSQNLVDLYRIISAVWHVRLGVSNPQSRVILNPNAYVPLGEEDANALAATLPSN